VLIALVKPKQDCFKKLLEVVTITRRISVFVWQ